MASLLFKISTTWKVRDGFKKANLECVLILVLSLPFQWSSWMPRLRLKWLECSFSTSATWRAWLAWIESNQSLSGGNFSISSLRMINTFQLVCISQLQRSRRQLTSRRTWPSHPSARTRQCYQPLKKRKIKAITFGRTDELLERMIGFLLDARLIRGGCRLTGLRLLRGWLWRLCATDATRRRTWLPRRMALELQCPFRAWILGTKKDDDDEWIVYILYSSGSL